MRVSEFGWLPVPLIALTTLGLGLWWVHRHWSVHSELLRKAMHVGTGLICLSLPSLFATPWPVLVLAAISASVLGILRLLPSDGGGIAAVLHGISRRSAGELYFPLSVVTLFLLSHDDTLFYVIPVLVLTLADAVAALVGLRYGLFRYRTEEGYKSVEGSIAFFIVAFLAVHVPLLLFTDTGRLESLLLGTVIGLLVMMLEAVAWRGLDNLFVPLGTWALLTSYQNAPASELLEVLVVTSVLIGLVFFWRRHTTLTDSSLFASVLVGYAAWSLGGPYWLLPPLLVFLSYTGLVKLGRQRVTHDVRAVGATVAAGTLCLLVQIIQPQLNFFPAYVAAFGTQLAILALTRIQFRHPDMGFFLAWGLSALQGWAIVVAPITLWMIPWSESLIYLLGGFFLVGAGSLVFFLVQPFQSGVPMNGSGWRRAAFIGCLVAIVTGYFTTGLDLGRL